MSLAARIVLAPSRWIALAERTVPMIGLLVAMTVLIARWPSRTLALLAVAAVAIVAFAFAQSRRARARRPLTLRVADRATFDLASDGSIDGTARLVESTVVWPGFAMLALSVDDRPPIVRRGVVAAELAPRDRRALQRFLLWSQRARTSAAAHDRRPGP